MKRITTYFAAVAIAASLCVSSGVAFADDEDEITKDSWPMEVNQRPLTLAAGMIEIAGNTAMLNMSSDFVLKPIALAPSVYYGVNKKLSVGVTHSTGICISGTENGCAKAYNDFGVNALYSLMHKGAINLAVHGGLIVPSIDEFGMGINVGATVRFRAGKLAIVGDPTLYVGVIERETVGGEEQLAIPVWFKYQVNKETNVFLSTGIFGALDGIGDGTIPLGLGGTYTLSNRIDVGAEFSFMNLLGSGSSADLRQLILRAALRL